MVRDLVAELGMGRVCYGPRCPGIAKRSFKLCLYFMYVLLESNFVKKLQENTQANLLTTFAVL